MSVTEAVYRVAKARNFMAHTQYVEIIDRFLDKVWADVKERVEFYASEFSFLAGNAKITVTKWSGGVFVLNGGLLVYFPKSDCELAIIMDAVVSDGHVIMAIDCVMDSGEIIADGPVATFPISEIEKNTSVCVSRWNEMLTDFLLESESKIKYKIEYILNTESLSGGGEV